MSTVTRPSGPLPARVYWARRLALLTVVVLVGWLMLRWIGGGDPGAAQPDDEAPAAATESEGSTEADGGSRSDANDRPRSPKIRTVAESFERPNEPCDLTTVLVEPSVSDPAYAGDPLRLTLRISSTSSTACSLGIDAEHLLIAIGSGRDVVWDSTRCEDEIPVRELALQPRWSALVELTWSGRYSGRNCAPDATAAEAGTYTVEAAVLEGEPTEAEFELVEPPEPPADEDSDEDSDDTADDTDEGTTDEDDAGSDDPRDDEAQT